MVIIGTVIGLWVFGAAIGWFTCGSYGFQLGSTLGPFGLLVALMFPESKS